MLAIAAYQVLETGAVDTSVGAFVGLVLGFYFGAHVSQNGASARARADQIVVAEALGQQPVPDALARAVPKPSDRV